MIDQTEGGQPRVDAPALGHSSDEDIKSHPEVQAWAKVGSGDRITHVDLLKESASVPGWTFLADTREEGCDFADSDHRRMAAAWLAHLLARAIRGLEAT